MKDEQEGVYKDDLAFLNKFDPAKVKQMSAPFKNAGRGSITQNREVEYMGKWGVVVGMYYPSTNLVHPAVGKLNTKFNKTHDNKEKAKK